MQVCIELDFISTEKKKKMYIFIDLSPVRATETHQLTFGIFCVWTPFVLDSFRFGEQSGGRGLQS